MLEEINIKNFKSIEKQSFKLSNLTVFSGLNSMGKSSIIQTLLLLKQSYDQNSDQIKNIMLNGSYIKLGTGFDILSMNAKDEFVEFNLYWSDDKNLSVRFECIKDKNILLNTKKSSELMGKSLFNNNFHYLSADRIIPSTIHEVSNNDVEHLNSIGNRGEYVAHYIALKGLNKLECVELKHKDAKSDILIDSINCWVSEITPGTKVLANIIPDINKATLLYNFETDIGYTGNIKPENVGFGLTYILPVVASILISKPGDMVVIENPEAHLHPAGQTAIANLIIRAASLGIQVIVETHSDHFVNAMRVAVKNNILKDYETSLYFLYMEEDKTKALVKTPKITNKGLIADWPKDFFDEWEKSLDILIKED